MNWDVVIGLEVHVQLSCKSKLFSSSSTQFGNQANHQASLIDLGMPGVLPVLNKEAVNMAIKFGLAVGSTINQRNVFARKNYFYPDLPKGYQISQLDDPIVGKGHVTITKGDGTEKIIGITRAHLEEDAGKSLHKDFHNMTGIDLNRAGTPLLEIVSEPDISSANEAVAYLRKIHSIIRYLKISDGNMAEGSMRCDVNISLKAKDEKKLGTRTELKNINSFRFVEKAIKGEIDRQRYILEEGGSITQETRLYDSEKDLTRTMRSKEEANDYRYFPDPDLLPVEISNQQIAKLKEDLPELPWNREKRFIENYQLSHYDAASLIQEKEITDYFERVVAITKDAKQAANWLNGEIASYLNQQRISITSLIVSTDALAHLLERVNDQTITHKIAKKVFISMCNGEGSADEIIAHQGLKQLNNSNEIDNIIKKVMTNNAQQVENYLKAEDLKQKKMIGFFVGQVMKASKGKANPQQVNKLLKEALSTKKNDGS